MFWQNFVRLCAEIGESPSSVAINSGATKSTGTVSAWKKGAIPNKRAQKLLAEYFHISISELVGEKTEPATLSVDGLSESEREVIELLRNLPEPIRSATYSSVKSFLENQSDIASALAATSEEVE